MVTIPLVELVVDAVVDSEEITMVIMEKKKKRKKKIKKKEEKEKQKEKGDSEY